MFYDLSLLNFLLPSKKNLEIGLPLVNVLTVSEFKAVLAHEFGHFAQKSMAVGRWVYLAQQIAGHIVAKRDGLDRFLEGLSRFDIRIAWVGWIFRILVWSIRSLVDSLFRLVVLADRALSREMEFQADRVSVGITGSDALINALYRLQAADATWDRALAFANLQLQRNHAPPDLYAAQTYILRKLRVIFDDPHYGIPPLATDASPAAHRIFQRGKIQVSRMWATHPASHEREENAKKIYLATELLDESSWELFDAPLAVRERMSAGLVRHVEPTPTVLTREAALAALDADYDHESYRRDYRGVYLARAVTRADALLEQLFDVASSDEALDRLYPELLSAELEKLDVLRNEKTALAAVRDGFAKSDGPRLEHRGRPIKRRQIPQAIDEVSQEIAAVESALVRHDRLCRSTFRALSIQAGPEWETGWLGLLRLLHYAEHTEANLVDMHATLLNTLAMVTAKRKTSNSEAERVTRDAGSLFTLMAEVARDRETLSPGPEVMALLVHDSWGRMLGVGEFGFGHPSRENINDWLKVLDGWLHPMLRALRSLQRATLDQLLLAEARLGDAARSHGFAGVPPALALTPLNYSTLSTGEERPRQLKLDAWSKFQTANGWWAGSARFAVAGGVVAALMGVGTTLGGAYVTAYNGLDRHVRVRVGGKEALLAPGAFHEFPVDADKPLLLNARTSEDNEIETLTVNPELIGVHYVYNVAGASPLVSWTASYGNAAVVPREVLGAPRWSSQSRQYLFEPPPRQISTKGGGGTREALAAAESRSAQNNLGMLAREVDRNAVIKAHAQWDAPESDGLMDWVTLAEALPEHGEIFRMRLQRSPFEVITLRAEQDSASPAERVAVCERHGELAKAHPANGDLTYLTVRCRADEASKNAAFKRGSLQFPGSAWFAYAAGYVWAGEQAWTQAGKALEVAATSRFLRNVVSVDLARLRRIENGETAALADLVVGSEILQNIIRIQSNVGPFDPSAQGYVELRQGHLEKALGIANAQSALQPRLALMVGASDGASEENEAAAWAAASKITLDPDTGWVAIALAIKAGRNTENLMSVFNGLPPHDAALMRHFVASLQDIKGARSAEAALLGLPPMTRAQAYGMGLIVWGQRAPTHWRPFVKRALFSVERPYFS